LSFCVLTVSEMLVLGFPTENEYQCCSRGVLTLKNVLLSVG